MPQSDNMNGNMLIFSLCVLPFLFFHTQAKKPDKRSTTSTLSSSSEPTFEILTKTVSDNDVTIKSKMKEERKDWPIREMIAILGKLLYSL